MIPNTTPTPNELYNGEMKKMKDTELRVVLLVTRATLGWIVNSNTGMRKKEDWISHSQLVKNSGRSSRAIYEAVKGCVENGWVETRDKDGNLLKTAVERMNYGQKIYYRLGKIFLEKATPAKYSEDDEPLQISQPTPAKKDSEPLQKRTALYTKETLTKETIQKSSESETDSRDIGIVIDTFKGINPNQPRWFSHKGQRAAVARMIKDHGLSRVMKVVELLTQTNTIPYLPTITTPIKLEEKWADLEAGMVKKRNEVKTKQREYVI